MEYPNDPYDGVMRESWQSDSPFGINLESVKDRDTIPLNKLRERARTASERLKWDDFIKDQGPRDMVNHPPHYTKGGIETIDYMEAKATPEEFKGHLRLTAIKYLSRAGDKDDVLQEYEKAAWYIKRLIETIKKERETSL